MFFLTKQFSQHGIPALPTDSSSWQVAAVPALRTPQLLLFPSTPPHLLGPPQLTRLAAGRRPRGARRARHAGTLTVAMVRLLVGVGVPMVDMLDANRG